MTHRVKKSVKIYSVKNNFYICYKNQSYEIKETKQRKEIELFLKRLGSGVNEEELKNFTKNEEIAEIYKFLNENNLLIKSDEKQESCKEHQKNKLENFKIKIISKNTEHFNEILRENLKRHEITKISINEDGDCDLVICIKTDDINEKDVLEINKSNKNRNQNCLFVDLDLGTHVAVGPFVIPQETACYECYFERRLANKDYATKHDYTGKRTIVSNKSNRAYLQEAMISSLIVKEVLSFMASNTPKSLNNVIYFDTEEMELWEEGLLQYPNCTICN